MICRETALIQFAFDQKHKKQEMGIFVDGIDVTTIKVIQKYRCSCKESQSGCCQQITKFTYFYKEFLNLGLASINLFCNSAWENHLQISVKSEKVFE